MNNQRQWTSKKISIFLIMCAGIWMGINMIGSTGYALASDSLVRLSADSGRLTGQLTQVTLRAVLGQLHDQLKIDYVAPDEELEKRVSITLQNEPLSEALAKILAPWDYVFSLDAAGNIKTLYVMAKGLPGAPVADVTTKSEETDYHKQEVEEFRRNVERKDEIINHKEKWQKKSFRIDRPTKGQEGREKKDFVPVAVQMEIRSPAPGTSMSFLPPNQKDMRIMPGGSTQTMAIIPPTAYPPMTIQPGREHVIQEMLMAVKP